MEELQDKTGEEIVAMAQEYGRMQALCNIQSNADKAIKMLERIVVVTVNAKLKDDITSLETSDAAWCAALRLSHICDEIDCLIGNYF